MGLEDVKEELRKQLEEIQANSDKEVGDQAEEPVVEETPQEPVEELKEEPKVEEPKTEEVLDNSAYARMRREKAAEKKRADELAQQLADMQAQIASLTQAHRPVNTNTAVDSDPEPDRANNYEAWLEWDLRQTKKVATETATQLKQRLEEESRQKLHQQAIREFNNFEDKFKVTVTDYDAVAGHLVNTIAASIKNLNPNKPDNAIVEETHNRLLMMAGQFAKDGLDPAEELYHLAKERYGYKPAPVEEKVEEPAPDLNKVAANRARSANVAAVSTNMGAAPITLKTAADMTVGEYMKLSVEEKRKLGQGLV